MVLADLNRMWSCPPSSEQPVIPKAMSELSLTFLKFPTAQNISCSWLQLSSEVAALWPPFYIMVLCCFGTKEGGQLQKPQQQRFVSHPQHWTPSSLHFSPLFSPSQNPDSLTAYVHDGICGLCEGTVNFFFYFLLYFYGATAKRNIYRLRTTLNTWL